MSPKHRSACPSCESISRRDFLGAAGGIALATAAAPLLSRDVLAAPTATSSCRKRLRPSCTTRSRPNRNRLSAFRSITICGGRSTPTGTSPNRRSATRSTPSSNELWRRRSSGGSPRRTAINAS